MGIFDLHVCKVIIYQVIVAFLFKHVLFVYVNGMIVRRMHWAWNDVRVIIMQYYLRIMKSLDDTIIIPWIRSQSVLMVSIYLLS